MAATEQMNGELIRPSQSGFEFWLLVHADIAGSRTFPLSLRQCSKADVARTAGASAVCIGKAVIFM